MTTELIQHQQTTQTRTAAILMKSKWLTPIIFLAAGLACGYLINAFVGGPAPEPAGPSSSNAQAPAEPGQASDSGEAPSLPAPASSAALLETVLPSESIVWGWADFNRLRSQRAEFESLFNEEAVQTVAADFIASLPQGATHAFSSLFDIADTAYWFAAPPAGRNQHSLQPLFAFTGISEDLSETLKTALSTGEPQTRRVGAFEMDVLRTDFGEAGFAHRGDIIWLCPDIDRLGAILSMPSPPENEAEPSALAEAARRFPDAVMVVFANAGPNLPRGAGAPGMIPAWLTQLGIVRAAAVMHWPDGEGRLSMYGIAPEAPGWAKEWLPLDSYPLGPDAPPGLLEAAFRTFPQQEAESEANTADEPGQDRMAAFRERMAERGQRDRSEREGRQRGSGGGFMPGGGRSGFGMPGGPMGNLLSLTGPNQIMVLNWFGFYQETPSIAFIAPQFQREGSLLERLEAMPFIESSAIEIELLSGERYAFPGRRGRGPALQELIAIERDGVMHWFDSEPAARAYLDPTESPGARSEAGRELARQFDRQAHAYAALEPELFDWILRSEMRFAPDAKTSEEIERLARAMKRHWAPAAASAGFDGDEWFVEFRAPDAAGLTADAAALFTGARRLLSP